MLKYKYIGDGAGVPGLPHEITQAEIDQWNDDQAREFSEALQAGLYVEVTDPKPVRKPRKTESAPSQQGA